MWCPYEIILKCFKLLSTQYGRKAVIFHRGLILTAGKGMVQELKFSLGLQDSCEGEMEAGMGSKMLLVK